MKAWIISHFAFVKEQKVKTNEEYAWGTAEHQVSGKNKPGKCGGEEQMTQRKVMRTWQAFLGRRDASLGDKQLHSCTFSSSVFIEHLLGTLHLLGPTCWVWRRNKE